MIYQRLSVPIRYSMVFLIVLLGFSYFSSQKLQAQTCPINVQAFALQDVPGFPQTDSLVVCGEPDTLAILIFPDPTATYPSGINVTFELPAGMQYAGFVQGGFPGNVVNEFDVSDPAQPTFILPNVAPGAITVVYIGVESNCELIPPESAPVNLVIDYAADQFGTLYGCTNEFRPIGEYNSAFRIPVVNLIGAMPSDLVFTDFTTPQCDTLVISQDGIDAYVDSFRLFISNFDLINEFTLQSIVVNGMPYSATAPNYSYDPVAMQASLNIDGTFFPPNIGQGANGDDNFDEGERLLLEICLTANDCASAQNAVIDFGVTYGCYDRQCFLPSEQEVGVDFEVDFIPAPVATSTVVQQGDICGTTPILIDFTLQSDLADAAEGLYQNLRFGMQLCDSENLDFTSLSIGGTTIDPAVVMVNPQPDGTQIIVLDLDSLFIMDPDAMGLADVDGDGYFDDLPGDQVLNFQLGLSVICSDAASRETQDACAGLACDLTTIIVGGLRSCGAPFQVTSTATPSANFSYGAIAVATNEGTLPSGGTGIFVDDVGVGGTNTAQQITFEHSYQFAANNIMGCTGTANTFAEIIVEGNDPTITDLEYIAGSAIYIAPGGGTTAIPAGNVTYDPLFDGARHRLIIDLAGLGIAEPTGGLGTFQWQFEMDECQCFQRAATFTSRIIETCDACTAGCGIVKSCESLVINVEREACPDCDCFSVYVTGARRVTAGYTDKSQTTEVDTAAIPQVDKLRFLPGDTLFTQIAWIYPAETNVNAPGFDGLWVFYANTQPVSSIGENPFNAASVGPRITADWRRMPTVLDTDRSKLINAFVGRSGGGRDPLVIPDLPCTRITSMQADQSLGLNNIEIQNDYVDHAEGFATGLWIRNNADGDCLDQFQAANNFMPGDTIYLEYNWKLLKNPGLDKTLTPVSPIINGAWYGQTAAAPPTFRYDDCEVGPSYDFYCPEIDCSTDVTVNACDVVVEHIFTVNPNDVPLDAFSTEFRPINGLAFADLSLPPDLIYSGDMEIVDYTGTVIGTVPASSLNLDNYSVVNYLGTDYYVLMPDSTSTIGVEDSEFQDGGDDRGGLEADRYPSEMDVDHTLVGGTFPLLGVGIGQDQCEFRLRYSLDRVCPDDIDPAEFGINKGTSYDNTARSFETSNFVTTAFGGGSQQYDTWFGEGTDITSPPNFSEGDTPYWPYSSTNFDIVTDITQPSGATFPNLYGQMQNPHNKRGVSSGANVTITAADLPSLSATLGSVLIADEADTGEFNSIDICAENDGTATLMNVSISILVPASVDLITVYEFDAAAPNNAGTVLSETLTSTTAMGTTYQLDLPDLAPGTCYQIVVETELLFCPIGLDISTKICIGATSSCLPTDLSAQLSAAAEGVCRMASECYEYISEEADVQVEWFIEPVGDVGLCEEVCYGARIKNVKTSPLVGIDALFFLPAGLEFVPGSWEVAYPGGDVNYDGDTDPDVIDPTCGGGDAALWTSIGDPILAAPIRPRGSTYLIGIDNSVQPSVAMNGLPGIQSETLNDDLSVRVDSNRIAFRFRAITICDEFTSGSALRFITNAQNPCEETISSNLALTDPLIIEDADPADFAQIVTFADPSAVNCGEMGTINFTVANTSMTESATFNTQLCLNIPTDGITYEDGSIRFVTPPGFDPMAVESDILGPDGITVVEKEICITVPDDLAPGDFFQIAFDYALSQDVDCNTGDLGVEIASTLESTPCGTGGETCSVAVLNSVNPTIPIDFLPPLNLNNLVLESRCDDDPGTLVYGYTFDLTNPGPDFMDAVEIEIIRDLDQDGMLDPFEEELVIGGPIIENVNLPMGGSTTLSGELSVPTDIGCPAFLRIRQNSACACDESVVYIDGAVPEFFNNLGTDQVLCPDSPLNLDICGDYAPSAGTNVVFEEGDGRVLITYNDGNGLDTLLTFEASPIDGADFSITGDQLMVALNDGFGVDLPVDLNLTVNQGFCTEEFSVNLRAAPDLTLPDFASTVCSDRKTTLDLMLEVVLEQNATITWSPTTFLDDPSSPRPQICNPTSDITYTVDIALNDSEVGCSTTLMAAVTVLDPGTIDLTYSGEVTCYDEANPPVLTATAGFGNYTFFVMVGGVEVAVQDGASNVYMPAAPGGTYFVRADDGSECGLSSNTLMVPGLPCGECPDIMNPMTPLDLCSGGSADSLKVSTGSTAIDGIVFVSFDSEQLVADDIYNYALTGGTVLGSTTPVVMTPDTMAAIYDVPFPENMTGSPVTYFVYALLNPTPEQASCRPFTEIQVVVNPPAPAGTAMDEACEDENGQVSFVLSDYDSAVDLIGGNTVTYHLTMPNASDGVNAITDNPYIVTSDITIFARVENVDGCVGIGTVDLTANQAPMVPMSLGDQSYCDGDTPPALTVVNPGAGFTVEWFIDAGSNTPVSGVAVGGFNNESITLSATSVPALPMTGGSVTVFAQTVNDATGCISTARTPITLVNNPAPTVSPANLTVCEETYQSRVGTFDLSSLIDDINPDFVEGSAAAGGTFTSMGGMTLTFHTSMADAGSGINEIVNPGSFMNTALGSQTLFVRVINAQGCEAVTQVQLSVAGQPDADGLNLVVCPDIGNSTQRSGIDLTALEVTLGSGNTAGSYTITWYSNAALTVPVTDPTDVVVVDGADFYAQITFNAAPMCSNTSVVTYQVDPLPPVEDITVEFCEDEPLVGDVAGINLRDYDLMAAGGLSAIVNWFEDAAFAIPVPNPASITVNMSGNGTESNIFYAQISDGDCNNRAILDITVFQQPIAEAGGPYEVCSGSGVSLSGASLSGTATMGAWTITAMTPGGDGVVLPMGLLPDPSIAVFTANLPGDYTLTLTTDDPAGPCGASTDEVVITVHPLPGAMPPMEEVCIGNSVTVDGLPFAGTAPYTTHIWTDLGTGTATGYTLANTSDQVVTVDASGVAINTGAGTVDLEYTVTDSNGCMNTRTTIVTIHPLPIPNPMDVMVCVGDAVTVDGAPTEGTTPYVTHEWVDLGTGTASNYTLTGTTTQVATVDASATTDAQAGSVDLQYTVTDVNGCSQSETVVVTINPLPEVIPMGGNITCAPPQEVQISVTTNAASPMYVWTGPGIASGGSTAAPTVNLPGVYTVTVTDGITGCMNMDQVIVTQDPLSKCLPATFEIKVKGGE